MGLKGSLDGGIILLVLFIFIGLSAGFICWHKQNYEPSPILVIRDGKNTCISLSEVVVGDVIWLETGYQVPADGLYIGPHSLQVDESNITRKNELVEVKSGSNPFLLSGSKVLRGNGRMLVTAVGVNAVINHDRKSPLEKEVHKLNSYTAKIGLATNFLVLIVRLLLYITVNIHRDKKSSKDIREDIFGILESQVVITLGSIPDGMIHACAVAIAYSTKKWMADQALVRSPPSCEAMASVTVICTNKEGVLTENSLKVRQFWIGQNTYDGSGTFSTFAPEILDLLHEGMAQNTTKTPHGSSIEHIEDQIQEAISTWGVQSIKKDVDQLKNKCTEGHADSFNSENQESVSIMRNADSRMVMHHRGTPEAILDMCSHYYDETGDIKDINDARADLQKTVATMKEDGLHCVAFACRSSPEEQLDHEGHIHPEPKKEKSILLALIGLKAPCNPRVKEDVMNCKKAGVDIKIFTKDDIHMAQASAINCGIFEPSHVISPGEVIEGTEFQDYSEDERLEKVENIRVIARASPEHKLLMVNCLQKKGHVVAVNRGTDTARNSSGIVIMDGNFASIVRAISWGRSTYNNVRVCIQFQLSASISATVIELVTALVTAISAREPVSINTISAGKVRCALFQVLWVKVVVGISGVLALCRDMPGKKLMQQPPINQNEPLITNVMWKDIAVQALTVISAVLPIQFIDFQLSDKEKETMISTSLCCARPSI